MEQITNNQEFMLVNVNHHVVLRRYNEEYDKYCKMAVFPQDTELLACMNSRLLLFGNETVYQIVDSSSLFSGSGWVGKNLLAEKWLDDGKKGLQVIEFNPALRQSLGFNFLVMEDNRYYCCSRLKKNSQGVEAVILNGNRILFRQLLDYRGDYESGVEAYISTMELKNQAV